MLYANPVMSHEKQNITTEWMLLRYRFLLQKRAWLIEKQKRQGVRPCPTPRQRTLMLICKTRWCAGQDA